MPLVLKLRDKAIGHTLCRGKVTPVLLEKPSDVEGLNRLTSHIPAGNRRWHHARAPKAC